MQTHIAAEIQHHVPHPVVAAVAVGAFERRGAFRVAPVGLYLRCEVENDDVAFFHPFKQLRIGILVPSLNHPYSLGVHALHGVGDDAAGLGEVDALGAAAFMEGVHAVVFGFAVELGQLVVIYRCNLVETRFGGYHERRAHKTVPYPFARYIQPQPLVGIVWHHARIARKNRFHAEGTHALHDAFLKVGAVGVPLFAVGASPAFEVVHQPPSLECRAGNEFIGLFIRIAQTAQCVAPHHVGACHGQRHVDAVKCHPVNLLFPAVPVPERHRVGVGAVVQIIPARFVGFMPFRFVGHGE